VHFGSADLSSPPLSRKGGAKKSSFLRVEKVENQELLIGKKRRPRTLTRRGFTKREEREASSRGSSEKRT